MAKLEHENICRIYDFGLVEERPFICMEYVESGFSLTHLLEKKLALPGEEGCAIAIQILEAILYAHTRGVMHRDLSPNNVLISPNGKIKITDFGLAARRSDPGGSVIGTPSFLSPEHLSGGPYSPESDYFSLGSLIHYLFTGLFLFDPAREPSAFEGLFQKIRNARKHGVPAQQLKPLPDWLIEWVNKCFLGKTDKLLPQLIVYSKSIGNADPEKAVAGLIDEAPEDHYEIVKAKYRELRKADSHHQAMLLIEESIAKHPQDQRYRDLLTEPWQAMQPGSATLDIGSADLAEKTNRQSRLKTIVVSRPDSGTILIETKIKKRKKPKKQKK